jgi:hypothetical protein
MPHALKPTVVGEFSASSFGRGDAAINVDAWATHGVLFARSTCACLGARCGG